MSSIFNNPWTLFTLDWMAKLQQSKAVSFALLGCKWNTQTHTSEWRERREKQKRAKQPRTKYSWSALWQQHSLCVCIFWAKLFSELMIFHTNYVETNCPRWKFANAVENCPPESIKEREIAQVQWRTKYNFRNDATIKWTHFSLNNIHTAHADIASDPLKQMTMDMPNMYCIAHKYTHTIERYKWEMIFSKPNSMALLVRK